MLRIGCIGFGGGSALIPVMYQEVVHQYHLVTESEFNKDVVVATITPGALPVEIATGIGRNVAGIPGMILASVCIALPGTVMTVVVAAFLAMFGSAITRQINFLAIGVSAYIIYVLYCYVHSTIQEASQSGKRISCLLTTLTVVALTAGGNLCDALDVDWTPIFSISTANVMAVAFFLIFFLRGNYHRSNVIPAFAVAVAYVLSVGKYHLIPVMPFKYLLQLAMAIMAAWGLFSEFRREQLTASGSLVPTLKETGSWILFLALLALPALFAYDNGLLLYVGKGCLSTLISFGGGDAYLAVATGMFVSAGIISRADFYNKVVATANAFPGSILCKVLSGVGYFAGYRATGSIAVGLLVALAGFAASVATSGFTFSVVACIYERFEQIRLFHIIRAVIRPIISGLLITVAISFFTECMNIGASARWPDLCAPLLCLVLALGCALFTHRWGHRPLRMVLLCAGISILVCNAFELFF